MSTNTSEPADPPVLLISAEQIDEWAGRRLTADQLERLAEAIPNSSIPEAIDTIVNEALDLGDDEACRDPFDTGCRESLEDGQGWAGCCGGCADRMEHLHHKHQWGEDCTPSNDGGHCTRCH
jgi:hypothetical protein